MAFVSMIGAPGYDRPTRLVYCPAPGLIIPPVPDAPTGAQVEAALAVVDDLIGEFPFADDASRANTLALLLTPVLRPAIEGQVPLALIDKPKRGTGASLIALSLADGKRLWHTPFGNGNPNCTPTVDDVLVFAIGREGDLICCDAATGRTVWT